MSSYAYTTAEVEIGSKLETCMLWRFTLSFIDSDYSNAAEF